MNKAYFRALVASSAVGLLLGYWMGAVVLLAGNCASSDAVVYEASPVAIGDCVSSDTVVYPVAFTASDTTPTVDPLVGTVLIVCPDRLLSDTVTLTLPVSSEEYRLMMEIPGLD
jgi:hypothetical protein